MGYSLWGHKELNTTERLPHTHTDTCIQMAESLCCPSEMITTLLISYTPKENKRFKKYDILHVQLANTEVS